MGASGLVCAPACRKLAARHAHTRSPAAMALACAQAASTLRPLCPRSADGRVERPLARAATACTAHDCFLDVPAQFSDILHFTQLPFSSEWPTVTISDSSTASGNDGDTWNYGHNFAQSAAHANASWTGGATTSVSGGEGMFGDFGVDYEYGPTLCTDTVKGETAGCLG